MNKIILHYEDDTALDIIKFCLDTYLSSDNAKKNGTDSITIYGFEPTQFRKKRYLVYYKKNKSGSVTGKCYSTELEEGRES